MTTSFAQTTEKEDIQLKEAYDEIKTEMNSGMYELSFNTFKKEYEAGDYDNVDEYAKSFSDNIAINNAGDDKWFYNTGTSLPQKPKYNRYNLLNLVKPGDIIYEENGSGGIFHHIAIVEGIFYDETLGEHYIRLIEAISPGVCRSVLDDERLEYKDSHILRVSTSDSAKNQAISFCKRQLGKDYKYDAGHDTSEDEDAWYCAELARAAYFNQGIDISVTNYSGGDILQ